MFSSSLAEAAYSALCWAVGFIALFRTDWAVKQALAIQGRFPNAFSSRLAGRSWYPTCLELAAFCVSCSRLSPPLRLASRCSRGRQ